MELSNQVTENAAFLALTGQSDAALTALKNQLQRTNAPEGDLTPEQGVEIATTILKAHGIVAASCLLTQVWPELIAVMPERMEVAAPNGKVYIVLVKGGEHKAANMQTTIALGDAVIEPCSDLGSVVLIGTDAKIKPVETSRCLCCRFTGTDKAFIINAVTGAESVKTE